MPYIPEVAANSLIEVAKSIKHECPSRIVTNCTAIPRAQNPYLPEKADVILFWRS